MSSLKLKLKLEGEKEMQAELKRLAKAYPEAANLAVFREAYLVFNKAQVLTPVDTNNLRGTAHVETKESPSGGTAEILYDANYAAFVHEAPPSTKFRAPGTQSKFLEQPVNEAIPGMAKRMAEYIKNKVGVK